MKNILMFIKTSGLEYDDRLRKECISLKTNGGNPLIVAVEDRNEGGVGEVYNGTEYTTLKIRSRDILPHKKFLIIKTLEMYWKFIVFMFRCRPDTVWLHNMEMRGLIPVMYVLKKIGFIKKIIWDQHELPNSKYLNNKFFLNIYQFLNRFSDIVIVANNERKEYILKKAKNKQIDNIYILNNFPDDEFTQLPSKRISDKILEWLDGKEYLLAQGGANPNRNLEYLIDAMMKENDLKLIVVGPYNDQELIGKFKRNYGKEFAEKILFTGIIPQMELNVYIDNCFASVILYANKNMNSKLCAPNRLYQAICRRKPVIVGSNPPMKNIIEEFGNGVVLETDGSSSVDINKAIVLLKESYNKITVNTEKVHDQFNWESQNQVFDYILSKQKRK